MRPRMVHLLAGASDEELIRGAGNGLALLSEHVSYLQESVRTLALANQPRGVATVGAVADEEAAKYLILVDAIRCPRRAQMQRANQLRRCYDHLAKGIYAEATQMRPADLAELRRIIKGMRVSHYLDGPNEVDWIFRNEIEERRERTLYVDYVLGDEGAAWAAPNVYDDWSFLSGDAAGAVSLVLAMKHAGMATEKGLRCVAEVWWNFVPRPETPWQENRSLNRETLRLLEHRRLLTDEMTERDARAILNLWTFPLHHEDLTRIEVDPETLRDRQRRWSPEL